MKPYLLVDFEAETDTDGRMFAVEIGCPPGKATKSALVRPTANYHIDRTKIFNHDLWEQAREHGLYTASLAIQVHGLTERYRLVSECRIHRRPSIRPSDVDRLSRLQITDDRVLPALGAPRRRERHL